MSKPVGKSGKGNGDGQDNRFRMRLFLAGDEPNSRLARQNLDQFCETYLKDRYEVEVVDVFHDFRLAIEFRVLVTPALMLVEPKGEQMLFGNLSDTGKLLEALGIKGAKA